MASRPTQSSLSTTGRLATALSIALVVNGSSGQQYTVTRIGVPPGEQVAVATDVNNRGEAAIDTGHRRSYYWSATSGFIALPGQRPERDQNSYEINESGEIVLTDIGTSFTAAVWSPVTGLHVLAPPGSNYSQAYGGNDDGTVVGFATLGSVSSWPFRFRPGHGFDVVGVLPGHTTGYAKDVNNMGVVAVLNLPAITGPRGSYWSEPEGAVDLGVPPGYDTVYPARLNDKKSIVGSVWKGGLFFGWIWDPLTGHRIIDIGEIPYYWQARGVNGQGHLVGTGTVSLEPFIVHSYFWREGWPKAERINRLLDPSVHGVDVTVAFNINEKGWIAGHAKFDGGPFEAVILKPRTTRLLSDSARVETGQKTSGGVEDLAEADGRSLTVRRFIVPNRSAPPVSVVVETTAPGPLLYAWTTVRAQVTGVAEAVQRIELFDWQEGRWDDLSLSVSRLGTEWSEQEGLAKGPGRCFTSPEGKVRARIQVTGPATSAWSVEFDKIDWEVTPED